MSEITNYLIEPLAPLVFRSGKPFGSQASAGDVIFPLPSAAAGLVRATSINQQQVTMNEHQIKSNDQALHDKSYQNVLAIEAMGPYLARFDDSKRQIDMLVPKPADALYFEDKADGKVKLIRLSPKPLDDDCGSDLPSGLMPVQMSENIKGKPKPGVAYWTLEHLKQWQSGDDIDFDTLQKEGVTSLPVDIRTHVAIDTSTKATKAGQLFQTASLDLCYSKVADDDNSTTDVWEDKRLGFIVQTKQTLSEDTVTFGGERRLSKFEPINIATQFYESNLDDLLGKINTANGFRLTFLTPCVFAKGYLPAWIDKSTKQGMLPNTNIGASLKACAIDRWQPVSGWDSIVWKPKAMRKAVSSGSVYWFELDSQLSIDDLRELTQHIWSDDTQDKRDGFGSAIIAPWQAI